MSWLTVTPVPRVIFDPSFQEFHDVLALRYKRPSLHLPINCDGRGSLFGVEHALDYRKKGPVTWHCKELSGALGYLELIAMGTSNLRAVVHDAGIGDDNEAGSGRRTWNTRCVAATSCGIVEVQVTSTDAHAVLHASCFKHHFDHC